MTNARTANSTFAIGWVSFSEDSFVDKQIRLLALMQPIRR